MLNVLLICALVMLLVILGRENDHQSKSRKVVEIVDSDQDL